LFGMRDGLVVDRLGDIVTATQLAKSLPSRTGL
jgi:hypothetical protein